MVELKSRILSSLSKLSDRDTHQIAVDDLEKIIRSLPADGFPMLLSSLLHDPVPSPGDPSGARSSPVVARRESIRLLSLLCTLYPDAAAAQLPKIIALIVCRLKDPIADSSLRDACRDAAGSLAELYLRSETEGGHTVAASPVAGLFLKPLLEVMGEQSKMVQAGAAMCLAKVVEGGGRGGFTAFQRLCPRICKIIGAQSFLAKGSLLSVISNLAQVGAISSQNMPTVLQNVRECLDNTDWSTRKAAADTLSILASQSSHLITEGASQTISSLEACRFDKVKLVRESTMQALQLWKRISGKGEDGAPNSLKGPTVDESRDGEEKLDNKNLNLNSVRTESINDSSADSSSNGSESLSNVKCATLSENTTDLLKIKAPSLKDKELNPEFFQKLESRNSDDLPVEVVLPRRGPQPSQSKDVGEKGLDGTDLPGVSDHDVTGCEMRENLGHSYCHYDTTERRPDVHGRQPNSDFLVRDRWTELFRSRDPRLKSFDTDNRVEASPLDSFSVHASISQTDAPADIPSLNSKGNWSGIQIQLSNLERQQAHLMNMLQNFMGGSHDSLITLEERVHGLERVVEEMARDLSLSSGRRGGTMMMGFEGSPGKSYPNYNGLQDYTSKYGRGGENRISYPERYLSSDDMASIARGKESRRSDSERLDSYMHNSQRNGTLSGRRGLISSSRNDHGDDQVGSRRSWNKGEGPFRLGEGPSARSVWQASKDEATLEAIRVAGEDNGISRAATGRNIPEVDMEATIDAHSGERDPFWDSWAHAVDSLHIGDVDSAYAEVLSIGDNLLLVKLMERSGPVIDELSGEVATEVLHAVGQFLSVQRLSRMALTWIQQLMNLVMESGADFLGIPAEVKRGILLNLDEASMTMETREDADGAYRLMAQLASAWGINMQHLIK
ncbi:Microtubule-associated protein TORTIFOLIA1 [Platanthera guangdongensis]|uniref:Microtubule-associated protein TORTIFOLIA1 n=1 Tax=Platanthera guangdongensis TaxID=2320717 RepID=A0ABR2MBN0_9ASPA